MTETVAEPAIRIAPPERFAHIDALRALAVLLVVVHHLFEMVYRSSSADSALAGSFIRIANALDFGRMGVSLFFIISGYVIGHSICHHTTRNTLQFVISRFFRLYPVYWASIGIAILFGQGTGETAQYLINLTMLQDLFNVTHVNGVYWTLTVELAFYAACIVLFHVAVLDEPRRLMWVFVGLVGFTLAAGIVRTTLDIAIPYAWPMFLSLFVGGMLVRVMDDRKITFGPREWGVLTAYLTVGLIVAVLIHGDPTRFHKTWYQAFGAQAGAVLLFVLFTRLRLWRPSLVYLGVISYSVYLSHNLVGPWLVKLINELGWLTMLHWSLTFALMLTAIVLFSSATYWMIERPGINLGRRMQRRFRG